MSFLIKFKDKFQVNSFEAIINRLQEYPERNLFLIDNLERREDFDKLKVLNTNFDLLITSRITDIDTNHQLNLETLPRDDARELFLSIYKTDENVEDILDYLDNHPLFINLCAKSLVRNYINLDELRSDIKDNKVSKIQSKDAKTFEVHLEKIFNKQFQNEKDSELKILLQKLSIFPSIEIDFEVYDRLLNVKKNQLQLLVDKGWLIHKENQYKLHQIIRTFIFSSCEPKYENIVTIFDNLSTYIDPDDSTLIANLLNRYIPIIESFLSLYEKNNDNHIAGLLDSLTYLYYSLANYDKALDVQTKSSKIKENIETKDNVFFAKSFYLIGVIYEARGEYKEALKWSKKALEIYENKLETNHHNIATVYYRMASVYLSKKDYEESLEWNEKALLKYEKDLGITDPNTATAYIQKASVYNSKGKHEEALEWYEKALKIYEKVLGTNHPNTAITYNNIAFIYKSKKFCTKANKFFEKALNIYKQTGYNQSDILSINREIKEIGKSKKLEKKAKFKDKGRYCKE